MKISGAKKIQKILLLVMFGISFQCVFAQNQVQLENTMLQVDTVISDLNVPWEIQWGSDGWIWTTERYGIVSRINPESGEKEVLLDLRDQVYQTGEAGLLGLALHPDFEDTSHVFLVYTYQEGTVKEKLVRYEYDGSSLINPLVLIDDIPGNNTHDGSRLQILPDYTLLMTTGDAQDQAAAQNTSSLNGKILRLHLDGSIPDDNPLENSPVWTWGHRNPQGLTIAPNGIVYSSEHGPSTDDEINIIEKGKNYGWPEVHGICDTPNENQFCESTEVTEPVVHWTPTIAPSDIIWYNDPAIPEFQNTILMAVLKEKMVVRVTLNQDGTAVESTDTYFKNNWGRLRDILQGPEGELYLATNGASWSNTDPGTHSIIRLTRVQDPVSIASKEVLQLKIFPNPVKNILKVEWNGNSQAVMNVSVIDASGKIIIRLDHPENNRCELDVSGLAPGIYGLKIQGEGGVSVRKFLKIAP